ncbi:MAG: YeeE/YedE thiosulfate transporter family protein [Dehalococcoidia bacterium]
MTPLILHQATAIHWAVAGAGIAVITLLLLFVTNRRLGISTGLEDVCSLVLEAPYFRRSAVLSGRGWRLPFLGGLVLGGVVSALIGGGWAPTWDLGMFDQVIGWGPPGKIVWMFVGGAFIGFGTRLAGGCTSGHGIFGLSNLEVPSLISTVSFMAAGLVTTNLVYRVIFAA